MSAAQPASPYRLFVGVDIAAKTFTATWMAPGGNPMRPLTFEQTSQGFASLQARLLATCPAPAEILVVMEATGSYWIALATTLAHAGFRVSIVNPAQAHAFAKALLKRAKTDAIDAQTLARLAALLQPAAWVPPPAIYLELQQRLVQREALIGLRQQVRNQRHALLQAPTIVASVRERMECLLVSLDAQIAAIERELKEVIHLDASWAATARLLLSIPGVGLLTAAWLLVSTLNFSLGATPEQLAAYAGLAPMVHASGTSVRDRPRIGHSGNGRLRTALYLATLSATRHNPRIRAFYLRLCAAGKPKKVARCAAARKLLHLAWAIARKGIPFDPAYASQLHPAAA
jgi:transposase